MCRVVVEIREAQLGDARALQASCKTAATLDQVRAQIEWTVREAGYPRLAHFVADDGHEVVGNVMLMARGAHALVRDDGALTMCLGRQGESPTVGRLDDFVVDHRLWGRGIGTLLARRVIAEARSWRMSRLETSSANPAAQAVFSREGFRQWGACPLPPGEPHEPGRGVEVFYYLDL